MDLSIAITDWKLELLSFPRDIVHRSSLFLKLLFFHDSQESRFISYTETDSEVSVLLDTDTFASVKEAERAAAKLCEVRWRAIEVMENDEESEGVVSAVSGALARHGFSIFYLSTYDSDFVLVKEHELETALSCLQQSFNLSSADLPAPASPARSPSPSASPPAESKSPPPSLPRGAVLSPVAEAPEGDDPDAPAPDKEHPPGPSRQRLRTLPAPLFLHSLRKGDIDANLKALLRLFYFPESDEPRFFSYSEINDSFSLTIDAATLKELGGCSSGGAGEAWRAIRFADSFGFDETGIVASLSRPLAAARISPFYVSTFGTDFVLVEERSLADATAILANDFDII